MKYTSTLLLFIIGSLSLVTLKAQTYTRVISTNSFYSYSQVRYDYGPYYFDQTMGLIKSMIHEKRMKEIREENARRMRAKIDEYKTYYAGLESYPETVKNGWHDVILISGDRFIDERKVYVENNKIQYVIYDNWMPEDVNFTGIIKDGKCAMSFKNASENLSGLLDVYFFNAMADPNSNTATPLQAAKLVFWTTKSDYKSMRVNVEGNPFGPFIVKHKKTDEIDPNNVEELIVYVKPGIIDYGRHNGITGKPSGKAGRINAESGQTYVLRIQ